MKFKKVLVGALALVSTLTLTACSSSSSKKATSTDQWDTYVKNGEITIGFDNTFVPMGYEDEEGRNVGLILIWQMPSLKNMVLPSNGNQLTGI